MIEHKGISASPGIAIGTVFLYLDDSHPVPRYGIKEEEVAQEIERFFDAVEKAGRELEGLKQRALNGVSADDLAFLDSHLLMLSDPDFLEKVGDSLRANLVNVEWILHQVMSELVDKLSSSEDVYLRERTVDIHDVSKRVLNHLMYRERISLADLSREVIVVGRDIMPSEAIAMNQRMVKGIAMDAGGRTSHTAILARAFEIPAVLGLNDISRAARTGDEIIVDGNAGLVYLRPDDETRQRYERSQILWRQHEVELMSYTSLSAETKDGKLILLKGNIEVPEEVDSVKAHGADGIGLYRSEFLFMHPHGLPSEEMQFEAYSRVLRSMRGRDVTIRTLDIGGDKLIPDLETPLEKNPLLGWRAIRFCLEKLPLFKTQLRALLRASLHGSLRIMFPLVSGIEELTRILEILDEVRLELRSSGQAFDENVPIGCMIEVPAAAMTADILARKVDFFSIGTNDLIQYTIAVDRGNQKIAYLYEPFHPAVLRLIKTTIDSAHAAGIPVSMCGEMAGDPLATLVLLGMGLDEFSMSAVGIPEVKRIIRSVSMAEAEELVGTVMDMRSFREIDAYLRRLTRERYNVPSY